MADEGDYILGTDAAELQRLGLQHRVWRPAVLECWQKAGITVGKRVLDVGAGPGYAAIDLAEIVGPSGEVVAVERSKRFAGALRQSCRTRAISNLQVHELDLTKEDLPTHSCDFSWCRWVLAFVSNPATVVEKIAAALRSGGVAIFHEYVRYDSWSFVPAKPHHEIFVQKVVKSWRATGGEPDIAMALPALLGHNGFTVRWVKPRIFAIRPRDFMWQWPATFIQSGAMRLVELGYADEVFVQNLQQEFAEASADPDAIMLTPLVLEIVAERT